MAVPWEKPVELPRYLMTQILWMTNHVMFYKIFILNNVMIKAYVQCKQCDDKAYALYYGRFP